MKLPTPAKQTGDLLAGRDEPHGAGWQVRGYA